jgi:hypothetical protein
LNNDFFLFIHFLGRVGKGIYFASENSKSAGYVGTTGTNVGFMFLNEVLPNIGHILLFVS